MRRESSRRPVAAANAPVKTVAATATNPAVQPKRTTGCASTTCRWWSPRPPEGAAGGAPDIARLRRARWRVSRAWEVFVFARTTRGNERDKERDRGTVRECCRVVVVALEKCDSIDMGVRCGPALSPSTQTPSPSATVGVAAPDRAPALKTPAPAPA
jgi:hypothetical protein